MSPITEAEIDRAAQYLREALQAGKVMRPWQFVPNARKKKWRALAEGAFRAAGYLPPEPEQS